MATYAPLTTAPNVVQIDGVQILPNSMPTIAVGEIARITVRENNTGGQGLIYYQGQLIKAALPEGLQVGDKLLAQLVTSGPTLIFQILEQIQNEQPVTSNLQSELIKQLETLLQGAAPTKLQQLTPVPLPDSLQQLGLNVTILQNLLSMFGSPDSIADPSVTLSQLLASTKGDLPTILKETAQAIRSFLSSNPGDPLASFTVSLHEEVSSLLANLDGPNFARRLQTILTALDDELKVRTKIAASDKELLTNIRKDLDRALSEPAARTELLQSVLTQLETRAAALPSALDEKTITQLTQLASRLEQMGSSAQLLNQLNPLMQALGEPALILFPFLFQGLLSHSRVSVDTQHVEDEGEGKSEQQGEPGKKKKRESQPFNRIQVSVPLPHLGNVDVDVAHRPQEIFVRFTVQDKEVAQFLLDQLEHLAAILREQGYSHAELVANVGEHRETFPSWALSLSSSTSVIA